MFKEECLNKIKSIIEGLDRPWVIVLIGPPLSGKDTFIRECGLSDYKIISRDQIVINLWGDNNYDEAFHNVNQKEVNSILIDELTNSSKMRENVIVNMTNMSTKRRTSTLSYFKDYFKIAIIFPILTEDEYIERNIKRKKSENKNIPISIVKNMISSYQPIEEREGFDKVISIS